MRQSMIAQVVPASSLEDRSAEVEAPFMVAGAGVVELTGGAALSAAVDAVWASQRRGEPAAWVTSCQQMVLAEDLQARGVDLSALAVIRAPSVVLAVRTVDRLLRSGGFGVVVVDGFGGTGREVSAAMVGRLARLAEQHASSVVWVRGEGAAVMDGALVTSRVRVDRARRPAGVLHRSWSVERSKRATRGRHEEAIDGPAGLC